MMQQEGRPSQQEDFWEEHVAAMHGQDGAIHFSRTAGVYEKSSGSSSIATTGHAPKNPPHMRS